MRRINLFTNYAFLESFSGIIREDLEDAGITINLFGGVDSSASFSDLEYALNEFIERCQQSDDKLPSVTLLHLGITYSKGHEDDFMALIKNGKKRLRNLYVITEGNGYQCDKGKLEMTKSVSDFHVDNIIHDSLDPVIDYINQVLR